MHNVINDPTYSEVLADMQAELKKLQIQYNDTDFVNDSCEWNFISY